MALVRYADRVALDFRLFLHQHFPNTTLRVVVYKDDEANKHYIEATIIKNNQTVVQEVGKEVFGGVVLPTDETITKLMLLGAK